MGGKKVMQKYHEAVRAAFVGGLGGVPKADHAIVSSKGRRVGAEQERLLTCNQGEALGRGKNRD